MGHSRAGRGAGRRFDLWHCYGGRGLLTGKLHSQLDYFSLHFGILAALPDATKVGINPASKVQTLAATAWNIVRLLNYVAAQL